MLMIGLTTSSLVVSLYHFAAPLPINMWYLSLICSVILFDFLILELKDIFQKEKNNYLHLSQRLGLSVTREAEKMMDKKQTFVITRTHDLRFKEENSIFILFHVIIYESHHHCLKKKKFTFNDKDWVEQKDLGFKSYFITTLVLSLPNIIPWKQRWLFYKKRIKPTFHTPNFNNQQHIQ